MADLWHSYVAIDNDDPILLIVGPLDETEKRDDGQPWDSAFFTEGPSKSPIIYNFITSFDHEPSKSERYFLIPEEYRAAYVDKVVEYDEEPVIDLTEEEEISLSLAIQFRITQLQEVIDRYVIGGSLDGSQDRKFVSSAQEQINCLLDVSDKLDLRAQDWSIE